MTRKARSSPDTSLLFPAVHWPRLKHDKGDTCDVDELFLQYIYLPQSTSCRPVVVRRLQQSMRSIHLEKLVAPFFQLLYIPKRSSFHLTKGIVLILNMQSLVVREER